MAEDKLTLLHKEMTELLYERVKDRTATAADLAVARQWMRDNQYAADPATNPGLKKLSQSLSDLPFDADGVSTKAH